MKGRGERKDLKKTKKERQRNEREKIRNEREEGKRGIKRENIVRKGIIDRVKR